MLFSDAEVCGRETGNNESRWNGLITIPIPVGILYTVSFSEFVMVLLFSLLNLNRMHGHTVSQHLNLYSVPMHSV